MFKTDLPIESGNLLCHPHDSSDNCNQQATEEGLDAMKHLRTSGQLTIRSRLAYQHLLRSQCYTILNGNTLPCRMHLVFDIDWSVDHTGFSMCEREPFSTLPPAQVSSPLPTCRLTTQGYDDCQIMLTTASSMSFLVRLKTE